MQTSRECATCDCERDPENAGPENDQTARLENAGLHLLTLLFGNVVFRSRIIRRLMFWSIVFLSYVFFCQTQLFETV